ncbi:hypothetical protein H8D83_01745 [Candidatus Woesearchaeota archaeon]|nr:hypothetical protein [Candidatus Woesearchaeota archaeon]
MDSKTQKQTISYFLNQQILLSPETIQNIEEKQIPTIFEFTKESKYLKDFLLLYKELLPSFIEKKEIKIDWKELDKYKSLTEKKGTNSYIKFLDLFLSEKYKFPQQNKNENTKIIKSFMEDPKKREMQSFVELFNNRYNILRSFLQSRPELSNAISIKRIKERNSKEEVALIGIIKEKRTTKNGNILFELEDLTGTINVLVNKNKPELFNLAENTLPDEVIGIKGSNGDNIIFTNNLVLPDLPVQEHKKSEDEAYAIFLSDLHVGSKQFLPEKFNKFLEWVSGKKGNETQKNMANKIKYIFIMGDLVDGVGIYPNQDEDLEIKDIISQYEQCATFLKKYHIT